MEEAALDNEFMQKPEEDDAEIAKAYISEWTALYNDIKSRGVKVVDFESAENTPDAIFPNNWVSMHPETTEMVIFPLKVENRRLERRKSIIEALQKASGFNRLQDLTLWEKSGHFLESTGSFVLDRINRKAFLCVSERSSEKVFEEFCGAQGFQPIVFHASDEGNSPYYHTNVIMAIGEGYAVVCMDAIKEKELLREALGSLQLIEISRDQVNSFCGNVIELKSAMDGQRYLYMSSTARKAFSEKDLTKLEKVGGLKVVDVDIPTIQRVGGGGVRCMIAEVSF